MPFKYLYFVFLLFGVLELISCSFFPNFLFLMTQIPDSALTSTIFNQSINTTINVIKRDGRLEPLSYDKIYRRIQRLCTGLDIKYVDANQISRGVIKGLFDKVTTIELDNLIAETAAYMSTEHPDYAKLAARISISNLHICSHQRFSDAIEMLYHYIDPKSGERAGLISDSLYKIVTTHTNEIDNYIDDTRDFNFDYFGFKTLEKSYLIKIDGKLVERPQYMWMRVALGIHGSDLKSAFQTYDLMSNKWFIHASPTLFHAGTREPQLSSCFLLGIREDSIEGIYDTLRQCALISKAAGGIGLSIQNIRAKGTYIKGTRGYSNGLVPMLRVYDSTARYVDQGGGKRPGAVAVYLEPWHSDIFEVLDLRKNTGKEEARARDLFYGLWIPDLFMKRVEEDDLWSLMCPQECPGLQDCWGEKFEALYEDYEQKGKAKRSIKARELWYAILDAQMETGTPYMLYKDSCNKKSNQQNLGTIRCSNLCTEIIEYTSPEEVAVCNLASIVLPKFVTVLNDSLTLHTSSTTTTPSPLDAKDNTNDPAATTTTTPSPLDAKGNTNNPDGITATGSSSVPPPKDIYVDMTGQLQSFFDLQKLYDVTRVVTINLNRIIDINKYPVPEAATSNLRHRPIGIGVQGLADAFQLMGLPFDHPEAKRLNKDIFETMYFAALSASCDLAETEGAYATYLGSPASKGILQHDMWEGAEESSRWDWKSLREKIARVGLRNSLLLAPMPTASTAQILGNNECFEPYTSNMYVRRVRAGEFIVVNPHLLKELVTRGIWNKEIKNKIIADGGSVQNIDEIPPQLKEIYRTVWEIKQRSLIDMSADRGAFIDQSQSLNAFVSQPDYSKLTSMHFYGWKKGLKTGMYYLRTKPAVQAIQFTIDPLINNIDLSNNSISNTNDNSNNSNSNSSDSSNFRTSNKIPIPDNDRELFPSPSTVLANEQIYGEACISCSA